MQRDREDKTIAAEVQRVARRLLDMIDGSFLHEIQQVGLNEMMDLTGSQVGFLYVFDVSDRTVASQIAALAGRATPPLLHGAGVDPNQDGYWTRCVDSREPVLRNRSAELPLPMSGDWGPIDRDLTVPVLAGENIAAVVMVGNRATDYGPAEAQLLSELAAGLWRVVVRKQLHDGIPDDMK